MSDFDLGPVVPQHWIENPAIKAIIERLGQIEQSMVAIDTVFKEKNIIVTAKEDDHNTLVQDRADWAAEIQKEMNRRNSEIDASGQVLAELRREVNSVRQQLDRERGALESAKKDLRDTIELLEAEARAGKLEDQFNSMMNEFDFAWAGSIREFQWLASRLGAQAYLNDLGGFAVFDQMGLGKTLEAWAMIEMIRVNIKRDAWMAKFPDLAMPDDVDLSLIDLKPCDLAVLWMCPNSIKTSTMKELQRWGCELAVKVEGSPDVRRYQAMIGYDNGAVVIANYETLNRTEGMLDYEFPIVVTDEAHQYRNDETKTFEAVETLCRQADFVVPMTGTPLLNKPEDLWAVLHMMTLNGKYQGRFADKYRFLNEYCWNFGKGFEFRPNAGEKLLKSMGDMVIRRRKDEVLKDLPEKTWIVHEVELLPQQRDLYNQLRDKLFIWMDEQAGESLVMTNFLQQLTRFRQMAIYPPGIEIEREDGTTLSVDCEEAAKLDEAMTIITELMDNGEKVIVFCTLNDGLMELKRRLAGTTWTSITEEGVTQRPVEVGTIVGGVNEIRRSDIVDRFNDPDSNLRVVLGNIKAMGVGLNMQGACSNAIFLDRWWNRGVEEQAEDRIHRQGQENPVMIHIIHAVDSVDNFIKFINERKQGMAEGTIEKAELRRMIDEGMI
jgi:SNF2 family DNA or RNA helicase